MENWLPRPSMAGAMVATWVPCVWPRPSENGGAFSGWSDTFPKHTAWRERWTDLGKEMSDDIRFFNQRYMIDSSVHLLLHLSGNSDPSEIVLVASQFSHFFLDPDGQGSDVFKCAVAGAPVTSPDPRDGGPQAVGNVEAMVSDCQAVIRTISLPARTSL